MWTVWVWEGWIWSILHLLLFYSANNSKVYGLRLSQSKCEFGNFFTDGCVSCWCDQGTGEKVCEGMIKCPRANVKCPMGVKYKDECGNECSCYESTGGAIFCKEKGPCNKIKRRNTFWQPNLPTFSPPENPYATATQPSIAYSPTMASIMSSSSRYHDDDDDGFQFKYRHPPTPPSSRVDPGYFHEASTKDDDFIIEPALIIRRKVPGKNSHKQHSSSSTATLLFLYEKHLKSMMKDQSEFPKSNKANNYYFLENDGSTGESRLSGINYHHNFSSSPIRERYPVMPTFTVPPTRGDSTSRPLSTYPRNHLEVELPSGLRFSPSFSFDRSQGTSSRKPLYSSSAHHLILKNMKEDQSLGMYSTPSPTTRRPMFVSSSPSSMSTPLVTVYDVISSTTPKPFRGFNLNAAGGYSSTLRPQVITYQNPYNSNQTRAFETFEKEPRKHLKSLNNNRHPDRMPYSASNYAQSYYPTTPSPPPPPRNIHVREELHKPIFLDHIVATRRHPDIYLNKHHHRPPRPLPPPPPPHHLRPKQYRLYLKNLERRHPFQTSDRNRVPLFVDKIAREFFRKPAIFVPKIKMGLGGRKELELNRVVYNHKEMIPKELTLDPGGPPMRVRFTPEAEEDMRREWGEANKMHKLVSGLGHNNGHGYSQFPPHHHPPPPFPQGSRYHEEVLVDATSPKYRPVLPPPPQPQNRYREEVVDTHNNAFGDSMLPSVPVLDHPTPQPSASPSSYSFSYNSNSHGNDNNFGSVIEHPPFIPMPSFSGTREPHGGFIPVSSPRPEVSSAFDIPPEFGGMQNNDEDFFSQHFANLPFAPDNSPPEYSADPTPYGQIPPPVDIYESFHHPNQQTMLITSLKKGIEVHGQSEPQFVAPLIPPPTAYSHQISSIQDILNANGSADRVGTNFGGIQPSQSERLFFFPTSSPVTRTPSADEEEFNAEKLLREILAMDPDIGPDAVLFKEDGQTIPPLRELTAMTTSASFSTTTAAPMMYATNNGQLGGTRLPLINIKGNSGMIPPPPPTADADPGHDLAADASSSWLQQTSGNPATIVDDNLNAFESFYQSLFAPKKREEKETKKPGPDAIIETDGVAKIFQIDNILNHFTKEGDDSNGNLEKRAASSAKPKTEKKKGQVETSRDKKKDKSKKKKGSSTTSTTAKSTTTTLEEDSGSYEYYYSDEEEDKKPEKKKANLSKEPKGRGLSHVVKETDTPPPKPVDDDLAASSFQKELDWKSHLVSDICKVNPESPLCLTYKSLAMLMATRR